MRLLLCTCYLVGVSAFIPALPSPKSRMPSRTTLFYETNDDENPDPTERMKRVRQLQKDFYASDVTAESSPRLGAYVGGGELQNLPLWRVSWNEMPGRTNVLNVHEPQYTNMFERILSQEPPHYFGHLYQPEDQVQELQSWHNASSAALGTLLRIVDYRRMADGRLLLLMQAIERIVITQTIQELPYTMAHTQVVMDLDDMDDRLDWVSQRIEGEVRSARRAWMDESFHHWHAYEYEDSSLELPVVDELPVDAVVGSTLAKVLPYAPLAEHFPGPCPSEPLLDYTEVDDESISDNEPTLEAQWIQHGVLRPPLLEERYKNMPAKELESRLWWAMNDFLKSTRTPVSPILLGLLPPDFEEDDLFTLTKVLESLGQTTLQHKCVRVHPDYPTLRRQKRLSYSVSFLLGDSTRMDLRRTLLTIPSTRQRLAYLLQLVEHEWSFQ